MPAPPEYDGAGASLKCGERRMRSVYPLVRLGRVLATARSRGRVGIFDESVLPFRVLPGDMDTSLHLNNGRYLTLMDLGRFDLIARAGLLGGMAKRRWVPVVAYSTIRHQRPLNAFTRFDLVTKLVGWDEQGVYLEQRFVQDGKTAAVGAIKGVIREGRRTVAPRELLALAGHEQVPSPPLPGWIAEWDAAIRRAGTDGGAEPASG